LFAISIGVRTSGAAPIRAANIVVDFPISRSARWKIRTFRSISVLPSRVDEARRWASVMSSHVVDPQFR
jgi:hypothetical protein